MYKLCNSELCILLKFRQVITINLNKFRVIIDHTRSEDKFNLKAAPSWFYFSQTAVYSFVYLRGFLIRTIILVFFLEYYSVPQNSSQCEGYKNIMFSLKVHPFHIGVCSRKKKYISLGQQSHSINHLLCPRNPMLNCEET